jgi:hypothetical protein
VVTQTPSSVFAEYIRAEAFFVSIFLQMGIAACV